MEFLLPPIQMETLTVQRPGQKGRIVTDGERSVSMATSLQN
jgi:hypothetical protein